MVRAALIGVGVMAGLALVDVSNTVDCDAQANGLAQLAAKIATFRNTCGLWPSQAEL